MTETKTEPQAAPVAGPAWLAHARCSAGEVLLIIQGSDPPTRAQLEQIEQVQVGGAGLTLGGLRRLELHQLVAVIGARA